MTKPALPSLTIVVSLKDKTLTLTETVKGASTVMLYASVVSGCDGTGTPVGSYLSGKWVADKVNRVHGPIPWSKDKWANPYGPYFLPLNDAKTGEYTTYGIHGTRGPLTGNFEKPPIPQSIVSLFLDDDKSKYLYCSHGCIRVSNQNITKLFNLTNQTKHIGITTSIIVK